MMTRENAIQFAIGRILRATDWQDVQFAMAQNDEVYAWVEAEAGEDQMDQMVLCQGVIGEAEERLGNRLPVNYS